VNINKQPSAGVAESSDPPLLKGTFRRDFDSRELALIAAGDVEKAKRRWEKRKSRQRNPT